MAGRLILITVILNERKNVCRVYWQDAHDRLVGINKRETTTAREICQIHCMVALFLIFPADAETFGHAPRPLRNTDSHKSHVRMGNLL